MDGGRHFDLDALHPTPHLSSVLTEILPSNGLVFRHKLVLQLDGGNHECVWPEKGNDLGHIAHISHPRHTPTPLEITDESPMASTGDAAKRWVEN